MPLSQKAKTPKAGGHVPARIKDRKLCHRCRQRKSRTEKHWLKQRGSADGLRTKYCRSCQVLNLHDKRASGRPYYPRRKGKHRMLCDTCEKHKPRTEQFWHKHKKSSDGLMLRTCRECRMRSRRTTYLDRPYKPKRTICDREVCPVCNERKPRTNEFWPRNGTCSDGLNVVCKKCVALRQRKPGDNRPYRPSRRGRAREICRVCKKRFPRLPKYWKLDPNSPDGVAMICKPCSTHYSHKARRTKQYKAKGKYTQAHIEQIFKRQKGRCGNPYCKIKLTNKTRHLDHKRALANGGTQWPHNLQWLCQPCNARKGVKEWRIFLSEQEAKLGAVKSPRRPSPGPQLFSGSAR